MLQTVCFQIPSPVFTLLLLVLMIQKTHGREIQYLKQEGVLPQRLWSSLSAARLPFLAAPGVTLLWQLPVGWELHHGANDRIIMKYFTSDVLERRARHQGMEPAHTWRILYNTYPRHKEQWERTSPGLPRLFFFFTLIFKRRDPASRGAGSWCQRGSVPRAPTAPHWDTGLGPGQGCCPGDGGVVGERGSANPNWPDLQGHPPSWGKNKEIDSKNKEINSKHEVSRCSHLKWNRFHDSPHSPLFSECFFL